MVNYIVMGKRNGIEYRASELFDTRKQAQNELWMLKELGDQSYTYHVVSF